MGLLKLYKKRCSASEVDVLMIVNGLVQLIPDKRIKDALGCEICHGQITNSIHYGIKKIVRQVDASEH